MEQRKEQSLQAILTNLGSVVVAFSGGADSALLLKMALDTLGPEKVLAATGRSDSLSDFELSGAVELAARLGARHEVLDTEEVADANYAANPTNRCYFCKTELYGKLRRLADARGLTHVVAGIISDDADDWRPGIKAAAEAGVRKPLADAGLTKADVRTLSKRLDLPTWDKPAMACLSSRFPYGEAITPEKLKMVERAEDALRELGFRQYRVRHHGNLARVELEAEDLARAVDPKIRSRLFTAFKVIGYTYVTLDLQGFRSGSMNEVL